MALYRRSLFLLFALMTLALANPSVAAAQDPAPAPAPQAATAKPLRDGFWIGFGLGAGTLAYGADASDVESQGALSGHFRLGGTLNQQWLLGFESNGWVKSESGVDFTFGAYMATATFYPSPTGNFFLKGGLGVGGYKEDYGSDQITAAGGAVTLGLGYDFRFSGNFGLSLVGNYVGTSKWEIKVDNSSTGLNADPSLIQIGLGVVWH